MFLNVSKNYYRLNFLGSIIYKRAIEKLRQSFIEIVKLES